MAATTDNVVTAKTLTRSGRGVTQPERQLDALQAAFYSVEERTFSEWIAYLRKAAANIQFYDNTTVSVQGHWASALPDATQALALQTLLDGGLVSQQTKVLASRPDITALMAFFTLMRYPNEQFADFTDDHKNHYYETVLGFQPQDSTPDQVNLVMTLSDAISGMTLPAGTRFSGGTDINDVPLIYATKTNAVLNHAKIARMDTLSGLADEQRVYTRHLDLEEGLEISEDGAFTFGEDVTQASELSEFQSFNQIGFTLASPSLYLSGGKRIVRLRFERTTSAGEAPLQLATWFDISISSAEGLTLLEADADSPEAPAWTITENTEFEGETYDLVLEFLSLFPAITGIEGDLEPGVSPLPHLHFMLKQDYKNDAKVLTKRVFNTLQIDIEVTGLEGIVAANKNGVLDTTGPIEPFTTQPVKGSRFDFTHPELLLKPITSASLTLDWLGRPESLTDYYQAYQLYRTSKDAADTSWTMPKMVQSRSDSLTPEEGVDIFSTELIENNIDSHVIEFIDYPESEHPNGSLYDWGTLPFDEGLASLWPKYYSFTLSENDFGHSELGQVSQYIAFYNTGQLTNSVVAAAAVAIEEGEEGEEGEVSEVKTLIVMPPYTPTLNQIKLSYESTTRISMNTLSSIEPPCIQHILPIGRPALPSSPYIRYLPSLAETAYLYIGLKDVVTPGQVRLYFQIEPVDGTNIQDNYYVDWRYMTANGFQSIPNSSVGAQSGSARVVEDSTQQLLNSGVVAIEFPTLDSNLSALGDQLLWLQVSIYNNNKERVNYSRIKGIYSQGVVAELVSEGVDDSHYAEPLPALSVTGLEEVDPRISEVMQPWPSFGAYVREEEEALAVRASERLRHKQRALTVWDYEHLVVNQFPEVYMARSYVPEPNEEGYAADIELMLVPVNHDTSILQPKLPLYMHERIRSFIADIAPPNLDIRVRDPNYEEVTFDLALKIYSGNDIDSVVSDLNQKLIDYLTPWQSSVDNTVRFRQDIHLTALAAMLEQDDAVDVVHYLKATVVSNGVEVRYDETKNIITPSDETAILVPSKTQKIALVDEDVAVVTGIGKWRIEIDFLVS